MIPLYGTYGSLYSLGTKRYRGRVTLKAHFLPEKVQKLKPRRTGCEVRFQDSLNVGHNGYREGDSGEGSGHTTLSISPPVSLTVGCFPTDWYGKYLVTQTGYHFEAVFFFF